MTRLPLVLSLLGALAVACSDDDSSTQTVSVPTEVVADIASAAIGSVSTVRAEWSLVSSFDTESAVVGRAEAVVDLAALTGMLEVTVSEQLDGAPGAAPAQEIVVDGDRAYRRDPGEDWEPSSDTLVEITLADFDEEGDDLGAALRRIIEATTGLWTATQTGGITLYRSADDTSGTVVEIDIDDAGRLTRLSRTRPPFGFEADEALRVGTETVFTDFDSVTVTLPPDLPSG